jgi:low molecular weight protein-tyrosine phosphatase
VIRVLFVCLGNICRSPSAEAVFRLRVRQAGFADRIQIDSAGTSDYHEGCEPDERAQRAGAQRGYDLSGLRARRVTRSDFDRFHYLLAMDHNNLSDLLRLSPREHVHKIRLFMDYSRTHCGSDVPDPYYGGVHGFERVLDMLEDAAGGLLEDIRGRLS